MKFDIMSYLENYKTLEFITESPIGAMFLCAAITIIVWAISYYSVGHIFKIIGFSGNSKPMSAVYAIISTILTSIFYGCLEIFKMPIAWIFQHWKLCCLLLFLVVVVVNLGHVLENIQYKRQHKSDNNNDSA